MLPHVTLRQLKAFETMVRLGGVTAAAEALHLSQPTLSIQIKKLSDAIGAPLYDQVGKKLKLTAQGQALLKSIHEIFQSLNNLQMNLDNLQGIKTGTLQVAAVTTAEYFAPRLLGEFRARYPGISVSLQIADREDVTARLRDNDDDIYIVGQPPKDVEVEMIPFIENPLILIASTSHPLAGRKNIPSRALRDETFIMREPNSGTRLALERYLRSHNIEPRVGMELVGSNEAIKQAVIGGLGIAAMSRYALTHELQLGQIAILDVIGFPIRLNWQIMYLKGKQLSVVAHAFCEFLKNEGKEIFLRFNSAQNLKEPWVHATALDHEVQNEKERGEKADI